MNDQDVSLVSLSDFLVVLIKRKGVFVTVLTLVIALAAAHGLWAKKTYELTGTINVGKFQGELLEEGEFVAQKLEDYSFIARAIRAANIDLDVSVTRLQKLIKSEVVNEVKKTQDVGLVQLNIKYKDREKLVLIYKAITDQLIHEHSLLLNDARAILKGKEQEYRELQQQIQQSIQADEEMSRENASRGKGPTAPELLLLEHTISEKRVFRSMLTKDIHDTLVESDAVTESYNTKLASEPMVPDAHLKPKLMLNLVIGAVLGLILATLAAVFVNTMQEEVLPKLRAS
ncbi:MAG: hypothetical protein KDC35_01875 [Acidobacteria bacterium]|nr:hypothetical protein [Acidobacteriota bacterium]